MISNQENLNRVLYAFYLNKIDERPNYGEDFSFHTSVDIRSIDNFLLLVCVPQKEFMELEDSGLVKHKLKIQKCYGTLGESIEKISPEKDEDGVFETDWDMFGEWDWKTDWIQDLSFDDSISDWWRKNGEDVKSKIMADRAEEKKDFEEIYTCEKAVIVCSEWVVTEKGIAQIEERLESMVTETPMVIKPKQKRRKMDLERIMWIAKVVEMDILLQEPKQKSNRKYLSNARLAEIFGFDEQLFRKNPKLKDAVDSVRKSLLGDLSKCACNDED
ncbi:MAG: hypothetical protein Q4A17_01400 [Thermoguttaceae bacterium]|nr:hypothetical protein [Thermoguttaceae bacterium]